MKRYTVVLSIAALLLVAIGSAAFTEQAKPKKKTAKKTTAPKPAGIMSKIVWYNMSDGYKKAKKEKKMLVVDVYTDWCYWCKVMDQKTYTDPGVIKKMNQYFVAVKFNPEVNGTHIVNNDSMSSDQLALYLNKGGRIPGYPMTYIWKTISDQKTIAPYTGYMEAEPFSKVLSTYIQAEQE